jgi:membrane protein
MNAIMRALRAVDDFQQRRSALAFPVAVWRKFNDDQAGNLAALISYYGFAALFPMLLVLVTVLNIVLRDNPALHASLLNSALAQYPVIGPQLTVEPGSLPSTGLPLVIGVVLLLLGARGVAGAMQNALCEVWGIPREHRPGFPWDQLSGLALVFTVGIGFIATTFLSGLVGGAGHQLTGALAHVGTVVVSLVLNIGVFWVSFRIATVRRVRWRDLRTGSIIAAVVWQVLQLFGGYVVTHQLHRASELYGTFGVVLGLLAWLFLQAEVTLYAAEVDVVLTKRLWPCSLLPDESAEPAPGAAPAPEAEPAPGQEPAAVPAQAGVADAGDNESVPGEKPVPEEKTRTTA